MCTEAVPPTVKAEETSDLPLLLGLARDAFKLQVAKRVRPLARSYVERWARGEFWLYRSVVRESERELRAYKAVVLETLRHTEVRELLKICRDTRPDLDDLWSLAEAKTRLAKEIAMAIEAVEAL
jgi:hypothetical protein